MNVTNGNVVEFKEEGLYTSQPVFVPNPNGKVSLNLPMFGINKKSFEFILASDQMKISCLLKGLFALVMI